jgi:hypothetical protein
LTAVKLHLADGLLDLAVFLDTITKYTELEEADPVERDCLRSVLVELEDVVNHLGEAGRLLSKL